MKRNIFAAWLMDIAKYIATALIISVALGTMELGLPYYLISGSLVVIIVILGLSLFKDKPDKKNKK